MSEMPGWLYNFRWGFIEDLLWRIAPIRHGILIEGAGLMHRVTTSGTKHLPCKVRRFRHDDPQYIAVESVGHRYATGNTAVEAVHHLAEIVADYIACLVAHEHAMSPMMHQHLAGYEQYARINRQQVLASLARQEQAAA